MSSLETRDVMPWFVGRTMSFAFAFRGLRRLYQEPNARIHAAVTTAVVGAGLWADISRLEWALLALCVAAVWAAEAINTAIELLADAAVPERHPLIGHAKDVAACAVLITAIGAVVVGALVFIPRVSHF